MGHIINKAVYDLTSNDITQIHHTLDRISLLQNIYGNDPFAVSIIVVVHETSIPLFARSTQKKYQELVSRTNNLVMGEIIEFRLCGTSARILGYTTKDSEKFIIIVPMEDAEIIALQHAGYAYLK